MPPVTKESLRTFKANGLSPQEAYKAFRADGGKQRKQDFLSAYRVITQKPRAAYNIGGAKRADVKSPKVEKYEAKREKKKEKAAKKPKTSTGKKKRSESHGKAPKSNGDYVVKKGLDVSAHFTAGQPDLKALKSELKRHGIRFFGENDKRELTLAKDKENGNVHLYGTAIYEARRDKGGRAVGIARELINKTMKKLGRQTTL